MQLVNSHRKIRRGAPPAPRELDDQVLHHHEKDFPTLCLGFSQSCSHMRPCCLPWTKSSLIHYKTPLQGHNPAFFLVLNQSEKL